jgi:pimeloyl-ACP methyl ester carboxylesterase
LPEGVPATPTALADQLERDLDRAGIGRAHLVGNSLGGWLALELAARDRAISVTGLAPALAWEPEGVHLRILASKLRAARALTARIGPYAESVLRRGAVRKALLHMAMAHADRVSVVEIAAFVRDNLRCEIYDELAAAVVSTDHQLGPVDCPVHIVWSQKDALIPHKTYGARMPRLVPDAKFSVMPDVGHIPMYDNPALVAQTILEFTSRVDRTLAGAVPAKGRPRHRGKGEPVQE